MAGNCRRRFCVSIFAKIISKESVSLKNNFSDNLFGRIAYYR